MGSSPTGSWSNFFREKLQEVYTSSSGHVFYPTQAMKLGTKWYVYMWVVVLLRLAASIVAGTVYPTGLISECMKGLDTPLIRQGVMIASPFSRIIRFPRKRRYLFIHKHILYRNKLISRRIDNRKYTVIIWYY